MSWGGVTNMVAGISTGVIGSTILLKCTMGAAMPSLWAFMGGSLAYVLSEIAGANALQAHIKAQAFDIEEAKAKLQEGDSLQRVALENQLSTETQNLEFVKKRKGWMYAVGAIYLAATTLAILEAAAVIASLGTYTGLGGCQGYGKTTVANGIVRGLILTAFLGGSLKAAGTGGTISAIGGLGSSLLLITPVTEFMDKIVGFFLEDPVGRSITFGVFTLLTTSTIIDLEMTQGTIEKNIADINLVLRTQYPAPTPSGLVTGPSAESTGSSISTIATNSRLKKLEGFYAVAPVPCASNSGSSFSLNSANCKKPMKVNRPNLNFGLTDNFLQSVVNTTGDYTEALASGNMARAEVLGGSLSNMAGRLKLEKEKALKKYNQVAKEKNKKILDFDKEVKALSESISGKLSKSLASQGIDTKNMMKESTGTDKKPVASISAATPVSAAPEVPVADLATPSEPPTEETAAAPTPTLEESLENFETNESDISPEKQVSIFKQVSNRYILNYNRFFREEAPVVEPVKDEPVTQSAK